MKLIRLSGAAPPGVTRPNSLGFGRGLFIQSLIDLAAIVFGALFICATACSLPLAIFMLLFGEF